MSDALHILDSFNLRYEEVQNDPSTARQYLEHPWMDRGAVASGWVYALVSHNFNEVVRGVRQWKTIKKAGSAPSSGPAYLLRIKRGSVLVTVVLPYGRKS